MERGKLFSIAPLKVNTRSSFVAFTLCLSLRRTFLEIQLVPQPESSNVLTLKYLPSSAMRGTMMVGDNDISASLVVLIRWWVLVTTELVLAFCPWAFGGDFCRCHCGWFCGGEGEPLLLGVASHSH